MDEILIGEKKYVSSKQAAKVTGYAKDYIGQLCREGRVPARLVGRSWYVLESAIHDHRFGEQKVEREKIKESEPVQHSTWEAPRYESAPAEVIPSVINRLRDTEEKAEEAVVDASQHLQDSWKAWFDRVAEAAPAPSIPDVIPEKKEKREEESNEEEAEEVQVPIRAVYERPPEELLPRRHLAAELPSEGELEEEKEVEAPHDGGRRVGVAFQLAGSLLALIMATLAVAGSGYFDEYIISHSQVDAVAGVILYNK